MVREGVQRLGVLGPQVMQVLCEMAKNAIRLRAP
jgi:hypothetical protein